MGQPPSEELFRAAADAAAQHDIDPSSDIHASAKLPAPACERADAPRAGPAFERAGEESDN